MNDLIRALMDLIEEVEAAEEEGKRLSFAGDEGSDWDYYMDDSLRTVSRKQARFAEALDGYLDDYMRRRGSDK